MRDLFIIRGSILAVCLLSMYFMSVSLAAVVLLVIGAVGGYYCLKYVNLQFRYMQAEVEQVESGFQAFTSQQGILAKVGDSLKFFTKESAEGAPMPPQPPMPNDAALTAIDLALDVERAFINGGTRSGKTFFCKQLAFHRIQRGDMVFALDPKDLDPEDLWPDGVAVVGTSDDYDAIERFWAWLADEKTRRGRDMANIRRYPFILIFFDEINDTLFERPEFKDNYVKVLRKFAQYRIGIFCIGQTDDVASIGLKGLVQLKECFELVLHFQYNKFQKIRKSFADLKDGAGRVELAPYTPINIVTGEAVTPNTVTPETPDLGRAGACKRDRDNVIELGYAPQGHWAQFDEMEFENDEERDIVQAYMGLRGEGANPTLYAICERAYKGKGGRSSKRYRIVRETLKGYGVEL